MKQKLIRITTVPRSLNKLLQGQLNFMNEYFEVIGVSSAGEDLAELRHREKINTFSIEMNRQISVLKDVRSLIKMFFFLKKEKPMIVHTHTPKAGLLGMTAAYFSGVPVRLHTVAGLPLMEASGSKRKLLNFFEKLTYLFSTKVYPNSYGLRDFILENKFTKPHKVKVIGSGSSNGIDTKFFSNSKNDVFTKKKALMDDLKIKSGQFVFLYVGRMVGDKGVNELISAYSLFKQKYSNTILLLVGKFEEQRDPLKKVTLDIIKDNDDILHVGYKKDVRPYFAISNVLLFPSYREGFPNVVLQAGSMGIPSVVTNINGCNEIVKNRENGLLIEPKNYQDLFQKMEIIFKDEKLYASLCKNSRGMIESKFSQNQIWKSLLNEYKIQIENFKKK